MSTQRSPLFVRLSAPLLDQLDARIEIEGRTKQAVVEELLSQQLTAESGGEASHVAVVADGDVIDLGGVAAMLRVGESDVLDRIAHGDLPGRRFGTQWRFSRTAVVDWLRGTDAISDRPTGFTSG